MNKISKTHTSCQECIFAGYIENVQFGCDASYILPNLKHKYGDLIESYGRSLSNPEEYEEFFVINNAYCYGKRKEEWGKRFPKTAWLDQIRIENKIFYQAIIFADDSLDDVKDTIASLLCQEIKPLHIVIVRPVNNKIRPTLLINYLETTGIKWKLQNVANPDLTNENIIDMVVSNDMFPYYSVFNAGFKIPKDFFGTINARIYDNSLKFAVLLPNSTGDGMVVSSSIHKLYNGNSEESLLNKIKQDHGDELLIPITQICHSIPE